MNIMKPEKNFQSLQSSTSRQYTTRIPNKKKAPVYLSKMLSNYQLPFQTQVPASLQLQTQCHQTKHLSHQRQTLWCKNVPHSHQHQTTPYLLHVHQMILRLSNNHQKSTNRSPPHQLALNPLLSRRLHLPVLHHLASLKSVITPSSGTASSQSANQQMNVFQMRLRQRLQNKSGKCTQSLSVRIKGSMNI